MAALVDSAGNPLIPSHVLLSPKSTAIDTLMMAIAQNYRTEDWETPVQEVFLDCVARVLSSENKNHNDCCKAYGTVGWVAQQESKTPPSKKRTLLGVGSRESSPNLARRGSFGEASAGNDQHGAGGAAPSADDVKERVDEWRTHEAKLAGNV